MLLFKFQVSMMSGRSSKTQPSTISRVRSLEEWPTLWIYIISWRCPVSNFRSRMLGRSSKNPLSSISRVGLFENSWFLTHFLNVGCVLEMLHFKFQVSRMSKWSSKTSLASISRVGSFEDRWFLTHFLDVGYVLAMPWLKSQVSGDISRGQQMNLELNGNDVA